MYQVYQLHSYSYTKNISEYDYKYIIDKWYYYFIYFSQLLLFLVYYLNLTAFKDEFYYHTLKENGQRKIYFGTFGDILDIYFFVVQLYK